MVDCDGNIKHIYFLDPATSPTDHQKIGINHAFTVPSLAHKSIKKILADAPASGATFMYIM
jgi:hypothetical protein